MEPGDNFLPAMSRMRATQYALCGFMPRVLAHRPVTIHCSTPVRSALAGGDLTFSSKDRHVS